MGFYDKKTFLNLNDIADVINTKGEKYNLNNPFDIQKLTDHLIDLAMQGKLTPVFYYDGTICNPDKTDPNFCQDFFIFDTVAISHFLRTGQLIVNMGDVPRNIYINYHTRKPYRLKTVSKFPIELLFPKHEIFDLFLAYYQSLTQAELQAEIERLKAEIERLTAELNKKPTTPAKDELTPKTQKAITKLLYALLVEHGYELGAKKGNTNDILQSLTKKHGVELSREFIAKQLDEVNKLDKT